MEALLIGLAAGFNFLIIKWKLEKQRHADAGLDILILIILSAIFGGTLGGMVIATIGSAIVSLSLLASPPKLPIPDNFLDELKKRLPQ